jgi:hypothetical protein
MEGMEAKQKATKVDDFLFSTIIWRRKQSYQESATLATRLTIVNFCTRSRQCQLEAYGPSGPGLGVGTKN